MGLRGALRKYLYKRKRLGGVLEAQNRKRAILDQKVWNPAQKQESHKKLQNDVFATRRRTSQNTTLFALKGNSVGETLDLWGPKITRNGGIW